MSSGKFYIAGPMAGYPEKNRASFQFAEDMLEKVYGILTPNIFNPIRIKAHDHGETPCPGRKVSEYDPHSAECYYRTDLFVMLECDHAVFLPGWPASVGARLEMQVASACGLEILFMDTKDGVLLDSMGMMWQDLSSTL